MGHLKLNITLRPTGTGTGTGKGKGKGKGTGTGEGNGKGKGKGKGKGNGKGKGQGQGQGQGKGKTNAELKHNLLNSNWHVVDTWSNNPERKVDKSKGGQIGFPKSKPINNKTPTKPKPIQRRNK